jgi:hypothetical protein
MDGSFSELNADNVSAEVDDYTKDLYKIQKVFLTKLKKLQAQRDEKEEERKRRRNRKATTVELNEDGTPVEGGPADEPVPEVVPPAALEVCSSVLEQMNQFKVCVTSF